jgi:beta-hydroxylase
MRGRTWGWARTGGDAAGLAPASACAPGAKVQHRALQGGKGMFSMALVESTEWRWAGLSRRRIRNIAIAGVALVPALIFLPITTLLYLACGALDIARQNNVTIEMVYKYFLGNGTFTWLLSPINLLADLVSPRNRKVYRLEDLPAGHRAEIESIVREFVANGELIKSHIAKKFAPDRSRCMLAFKWYTKQQESDLKIPGFERDYRFIKTIAVSAFNGGEYTSWHFGPLRLTFRVLFNLDPSPGRDAYIEADGVTHYWSEDPLFVFDDTVFHQSVNRVAQARYCLFADIVRPSYFPRLMDAAVFVISLTSAAFKQFYRNWSFVR